MTDKLPLPLVTVVTPSYNQGRFIEETILSVLGQDYPNIEYLIIDGGSTDNTLDILKKYKESLSWVSEPDHGQSHAINKGFKKANGEILCWLNSDDFFEPGAISAVVAKFIQNDNVMMVYGDGNLVNENGELISLFPYTRPFDLWSLIHQLDYILQPTAFFRNAAIKKIDFIDEKLNWCMDWDLWIRIGSRFQVEYINQCFANARIYKGTKTATGGIKRYLEILSVLRLHSKRVILPAYIIYGSGMITSYMHFASIKWYKLVKRILRPVQILLWAFASNAQGVYQDGWLGRKAKFMFASGLSADTISFELDLPDNDQIMPNEVSISVDGRILSSKCLAMAGLAEVSIPYDPFTKSPTEVILDFKRALPQDSKLRRLACRLKRVDLKKLSI